MPVPDPKPVPEYQACSFQPIFSPVEADLWDVQRRIHEVIQTDEPFLRDRLLRLMDPPGKMIRPALVLLAARACGNLQREHIELAAIVELIHTATLLHDDVIDQASVRRRHPSANALWGNTAAVLLGDFLLSRAFALGIGLQMPEMSEWLIRTAEEICQGELLQNLHRADWELTEERYFRIIDGKTAALFAAGTALGTRAAGAEESAVRSLEQYGRRFGQAYQIRDDLLDLLGDEETCGKTLGTDLAESKPTLPLIVWLRTLPAARRRREERHLSEGTDYERIREEIRRSEAVSFVQQTIRNYCEQACESLRPIPESPAKEALLRLAQILSCRV